jgi:hypothetical protein
MSSSTIWLKSWKKWRWMLTIWSIAFFFQANEIILNRVKFVLRRCFLVIFNQINRSCSIRDRFRCFCQICFFKTCRSRICLHRFWTMKNRIRFLINAFIVMKRIIYTRKIALRSMKILKSKKFICKKEKFILIFITSKLFTFKWFRIKINDNAWRTSRSWFIQIASSQLRSEFIRFAWKKTRRLSFLLTKRKKKSFWEITNFTQTSTSFWLQRDQSLKFLKSSLNITRL